MYFAYSLLLCAGLVLAAPYYLWRMRRKKVLPHWRERLGFLPPSMQQAEGGAIWVHAVSVGETLAVVGLVQELQRNYPSRKVFLSHVTAAGREAGEHRLPHVAGRFYLPLDWVCAVRRALARIRPALLVIVETELWPNLLHTARTCGCRVVVVNARLSDRSFRRYCLVRPFMRRVLENVDRVCAQTSTDAERFRTIGAAPDRVTTTGNLKFDSRPPKPGDFARRLRDAIGAVPRRPVLVAASTMPGEEPLVLEAWDEVRRKFPQGLLVLAPRHPERFEGVARLLVDSQRSMVRRADIETAAPGLIAQLRSPEILLLDSIGELAGLFEVADVVFVGGTLVPTGGHNLLEPAYWGKPIIFGPHMHNFRDVAKLFLDEAAAVQVQSARELGQALLALLHDEKRSHELGGRARKLLEREGGATARVINQIREILGTEAAVRAKA
ncbi:MAG TPA: 3-deoxy-D-manno-octulosonic acid transferase [Terriglobia bacterium]|jgi:3-deoxy-D-manno-octulosonic-acid transferase|nr:3-deoxy-D-manno-octulosonic acid transferase [Terriglobia bacterium]